MRATIFLLVLLTTTSSNAEPLRLLAWNVESGGNDPAVIAKQLHEELSGYHIYGLSEVDATNATTYRKAAGDNFASVLSVTGNRDRLLLLYDKDRLELVESHELEAHDGVRMNDVNFRHRSPLVGYFKTRETNEEFVVVLVHLARGNAELRTQQAKGLRLWCADQKLPVFGIGDFNFDFDFPTQKGNEAYDEFLSDGTWTWVRPAPHIDTNWSDRDEDGKDDYPDSCLVFVFVGKQASSWGAWSRVIVRNGDFPDDDQTSDHRPVELIAEPSLPNGASSLELVPPGVRYRLARPKQESPTRKLALTAIPSVEGTARVTSIGGREPDEVITSKLANGKLTVASWGEIHIVTFDGRWGDNIELPPAIGKRNFGQHIEIGYHPLREPFLRRYNLVPFRDSFVPNCRVYLRAPGLIEVKAAIEKWRNKPPLQWKKPNSSDEDSFIVFDKQLGRHLEIMAYRVAKNGDEPAKESFAVGIVPHDEKPSQP